MRRSAVSSSESRSRDSGETVVDGSDGRKARGGGYCGIGADSGSSGRSVEGLDDRSENRSAAAGLESVAEARGVAGCGRGWKDWADRGWAGPNNPRSANEPPSRSLAGSNRSSHDPSATRSEPSLYWLLGTGGIREAEAAETSAEKQLRRESGRGK